MNKVFCIDENTILRTIENCKAKLISGHKASNQGDHHKRNVFSESNSFNSNNGNFEKQQSGQGPRRESDNSRPYNQQSNTHRQDNRQSESNRGRKNNSGYRQGSGNADRNQRQDKRQDNTDFGGPSNNNKRTDNNQNKFRRKDKPQNDQYESSSDFGGPSNAKSNQFNSPFEDMSKHTQGSQRAPKNLPPSFNVTVNPPQKINSSSSSTGSDNRRVDIGEKMKKISMEIGSEYDVTICFADPNKENICWVHEKKTVGQLEDLMLEIFEAEPNLKTINNPKRGDLVLSLFEGTWCRAVVLSNYTVQYLDYGNQGPVESCKPLPVELQKIPALAARFVISRNTKKLHDDMQFTAKIERKYDDDTYLVEMFENTSEHSVKQTSITKEKVTAKSSDTDTETPEKKNTNLVAEKKSEPEGAPIPTEEKKNPQKMLTDYDICYFNIPKPIYPLKDGDVVAVVEFEENTLYLKTKQCMDQAKKIKGHIRDLDKSELLINDVKEGQLVLCSKDGIEGLCRAFVKDKQSTVAVNVEYIDYPGTDILSIKSLRNVDETLSAEPAALYIIKNVPLLKGLGIPEKNYMNEIIIRKEKLTIKKFGDNIIDFQQQNGEFLSETFEKMKKVTKPVKKETPEPKQETPEPKRETPKPKQEPTTSMAKSKENERVFYDNMKWLEVEPGIHEFICYAINDVSDLNLVLQRDDVIAHMELLTELQIDDERPFKPEPTEMCIVYNETDGMWERAVVLSDENNEYLLTTVDFGSELTVKSDKLRSFPAYLKDVPIIGLPCELEGIPNTPEVNAVLQDVIKEGENLVVKVKEFNEETLKYKLEHQALTDKLKSKGLC